MRGICRSHNVSRSPRWQTASRAWWWVVFAETVMSSLGRWCTAVEITWPRFCLINRGPAQRIGCDVGSWSDDWKYQHCYDTPLQMSHFCKSANKIAACLRWNSCAASQSVRGNEQRLHRPDMTGSFLLHWSSAGSRSPLRAPNPNYKHVANKSLYLHDMRLLSSSPCTLAFFSTHILFAQSVLLLLLMILPWRPTRMHSFASFITAVIDRMFCESHHRDPYFTCWLNSTTSSVRTVGGGGYAIRSPLHGPTSNDNAWFWCGPRTKLFCVILLSLNIANQVLTACLQKLLHKSLITMSHD